MTQKEAIQQYVRRKIARIASDEKSAKATLARLRRGIGKEPGELPELWPIIFEDLPHELESDTGHATRAEWAVYSSLTLYALHQQGHDTADESMNREGKFLGIALCELAGGDDDAKDRIKRRFDAMATAGDMPGTVYHLRGLVQLLKASDIPLDYVALAADLYSLQFEESAPAVKLKWGRDFYRIHKDTTAEATETV